VHEDDEFDNKEKESKRRRKEKTKKKTKNRRLEEQRYRNGTRSRRYFMSDALLMSNIGA